METGLSRLTSKKVALNCTYCDDGGKRGRGEEEIGGRGEEF
jgi:hypothetical protein